MGGLEPTASGYMPMMGSTAYTANTRAAAFNFNSSLAPIPTGAEDDENEEWYERNDFGNKTSDNELSPGIKSRTNIKLPAQPKLRMQLKHDPSIAHAITKSVLAKPLVKVK